MDIAVMGSEQPNGHPWLVSWDFLLDHTFVAVGTVPPRQEAEGARGNHRRETEYLLPLKHVLCYLLFPSASIVKGGSPQ